MRTQEDFLFTIHDGASRRFKTNQNQNIIKKKVCLVKLYQHSYGICRLNPMSQKNDRNTKSNNRNRKFSQKKYV
jgi:hypothetical protein